MNNIYDILKKLNTLTESRKPDFPDIDNDGNRTEPIAKAAKEVDEASYSAKAARAGKDIGKPGKNFEKIAKSAAERYGSKERGEKVAGAVLAKLRAKESIDEADVEEGNEFSGARQAAIKAGKPTFTVAGKTYRVSGDTSDEKRMDEGYVDFMDKKEQYRKIGAEVEGKSDDYVVTFKDGSRKRYQELDGRRRVTTLEPVERNDAVDDEGEIVKRGRGRPKGSKRSLGAKGPSGRSKLMTREQNVAEATGNLDSIVRANQRDVDAFMRGGDLSDGLYNVLFDYYMDEMPYGTAKARTGDPYEWISDRFYNDMGGGKQGVAEDYDKDEYDEEGEMAKSQARTIEDAAKELQDILDDDENLPEWVQKKIVLAKEYIDSARDYMKANPDEEEVDVEVDDEELVAEKAVSKAQRAAAGIAYAAKKGDIPKSELRGASKEMADMPSKELKKFAKTKEKGLPEKVKETDKEEVEETTTSGSVAVSTEAPKSKKGSMQFGKGVYESQIAESFERKLGMLTEGMNINMSMDAEGGKSLTVSATDDDAVKLAQLLKLAGMQSAHGYEETCSVCGQSPCGCDQGMAEGEYANSPDVEEADTDTMVNKLSGGLNGRKTTGQTTVPVIASQLDRQFTKVQEEAESRLWNLYKKYEN